MRRDCTAKLFNPTEPEEEGRIVGQSMEVDVFI